MLIDLAVNSFGVDVGDMVRLAQTAEAVGYCGVWVTDHFSGAVVGAPWARDPFVSLGAIAASTVRVPIGVLVANMMNRHPAQLAAAINSLQSLAPGRVRLGVGSGAAPGSRFAVEHEAIGTRLDPTLQRQERLIEYIAALGAIWAGRTNHESSTAGFSGLDAVTDGRTRPPIIVGASAWSTVELALEHADGVNVRRTERLAEVLRRIATMRPDHFEVSVLDVFDDVVDDPAVIDEMAEMGVDRLILGTARGLDPARLTDLGMPIGGA